MKTQQQIQQQNLSMLFRITEALRATLDPIVPLSVAAGFLFVAVNEGCTQKDVQIALGINQTGASRIMLALSENEPLRGRGQYGLVKAVPNADDRRLNCLFLTPKGKRIVEKLSLYVDIDMRVRSPQ